MTRVDMPLGTGDQAAREAFYQRVQAGWLAPMDLPPWTCMGDPATGSLPRDPDSLWQAISAHEFNSAETPDDPLLLAFHAPLGLTEGAWLQGLARPDNGHRQEVAALFAGYRALIGRDEAGSPTAAYRGLLARCGCQFATVTSIQFAQDPRVGAAALEFASQRLELGWRAAALFPELLGYTLAYAGSQSPWRLAGLESADRQKRLRDLASAAFQSLRGYLELDLDHEETWRRVCAGFSRYRTEESTYLTALASHSAHRPSLRDQVAGIIQHKASIARGYHGAAQMAGKTLDTWFSEEPFDAAGFMAAFQASGFVAGPEGERPFDRLTGFGGPMFGIFNEQELATINGWLEQAQGAPGEVTSQVEVGFRPDPVAASRAPREASSSSPHRFDSRELFHHLVNADLSGAVSDAARNYAERILLRAERRIRRTGPLKERFFDYSPGTLEARVKQLHQREVARYRPFAGRPRLRLEEYRFGIRQFAPAILVDGCWLQRACGAAQQDLRLHRLLLQIYADELGDGHAERNHPNVYRRLLRQAGIDLPEAREMSFAKNPEFLDSAFDLPAYLLSISIFPGQWLPEILGLNLAIELSGLGAQYRFLADELEHWGLDPLIVRLHQSIDSLAGGHAALALEAVQIHLENVRVSGGDEDVARHWRRVWRGYLSLSVASRGFGWALIVRFVRGFVPARLAGSLKSHWTWGFRKPVV